MEDLKVRNMSRSTRGTKDNPKEMVKAKSGLNRSILDQGWSMFEEYLSYKLQLRGGKLILVDPKNTSIRCRKCEYVAKENRSSQSVFNCTRCGHLENADLNAR